MSDCSLAIQELSRGKKTRVHRCIRGYNYLGLRVSSTPIDPGGFPCDVRQYEIFKVGVASPSFAGVRPVPDRLPKHGVLGL